MVSRGEYFNQVKIFLSSLLPAPPANSAGDTLLFHARFYRHTNVGGLECQNRLCVTQFPPARVMTWGLRLADQYETEPGAEPCLWQLEYPAGQDRPLLPGQKLSTKVERQREARHLNLDLSPSSSKRPRQAQ